MIATLGPMLFQPCAEDLAARLQVAKSGSVLELACGTGILMRAFTQCRGVAQGSKGSLYKRSARPAFNFPAIASAFFQLNLLGYSISGSVTKSRVLVGPR